MGWTKVGGPAHSLAVFSNHLAALTPDRQAVNLRDPSSGIWKSIGGPATSLIGGGWDLYAVAPGAGDLWRYDGNNWSRTGGPGFQFVGICNSVYMLNPDCTKLFRYDRYSNSWTQIGGPAQSIIGGGSKVYAAAPSNKEIWEYSRYLNTWKKIGGAGSMWVGVGGTVYGLAPDKSAVFKYNGTPDSWTQVGGPATSLIGGGSSLYAIQPGTGKLWQYSGNGQQWSEIGTPGTGFVAEGGTIYGMTTDKKEVHQFTDDNTESKRLRDLLYNCYEKPEFGNRVSRGFMVMGPGGEVLAEHCSDVCFQPLSTLKLLPYVHTLIEVDKGAASLAGTSVSWVQPTTGSADDMNNKSCLIAGASGTQAGSATLADALPTMMWFSHNRTLDAMLVKYGPANITARAQSLGLTQTEMYFGCPQPSGSNQPWANNISTLKDIARLFEGIENLRFVTAASTRTAFRNNMITLSPLPGTSYTSPIINATVGPYLNDFLWPIVSREAGAAKQSIAYDFMKYVLIRGKGGGGGPNGIEVGASDFIQLGLPFNSGGAITIVSFLVGWFVCQMIGVEDSVRLPEDKELEVFRREIHTLPIRLALASW